MAKKPASNSKKTINPAKPSALVDTRVIYCGDMGAIASGGTDWRTGIAGAGISFAVSFYQSLREDRNVIKEHPLGYLYKAQEKFGTNR
jgi:hypothetical protein